MAARPVQARVSEMKVDESGAPWPYDTIEPEEDEPGPPTWTCPGGECQCNATTGEAEREEHRIFFFDGEAQRMKGARCRVVENGHLLNKEAPYADANGVVTVKVRRGARSLQLAWAPAEVPAQPGLPYRKLYHLDLGEDLDPTRRRLHNLGFSHHASLDENIRDYQRAYRKAETGRAEDVEFELAAYHDQGTLPPVPRDDGKDSQRVAKGPPGEAPVKAGGPGGGAQKQGSAAAVQMTKLRVRVRTRAGRGIEKAKVTIDFGGTPIKKDTGPNGFAIIVLTKDQLGEARPENEVKVSAKKLHHGPEPRGATKVTPGEIEVKAQVEPGKGFADVQPDQSLLDPSTPGVAYDKQGSFLELVLRDACMNRAEVSPKVTRRLEDDEVQRELMFHHISGTITLAPTSEMQFKHDESTGELGPCTPGPNGCRIERPEVDRWVALQTSTMGQVTFFHLNDFRPSPPREHDAIPGQRFTREKLDWKLEPLTTLDQRHVVGLVRLCERLHRDHEIVAIYTQGVNGNSTQGETHGYGLAIDFGGCSTELPSQTAKTQKGSRTTPVRLGVDFVVFLHWGRVPMWDPTTVAKNPDAPSLWKRFPETDPDPKAIDYRADPTGKTNKLHYRLDPPPYQDKVPEIKDEALAAELAKVAPHFRKASALFKAIYEFAADEYSDSNDLLRKLPAGKTDTRTPIDDQEGHFILHPDYAKPNVAGDKFGRQAHVNHHHFQLGPTKYKIPGTETPKPRTR